MQLHCIFGKSANIFKWQKHGRSYINQIYDVAMDWIQRILLLNVKNIFNRIQIIYFQSAQYDNKPIKLYIKMWFILKFYFLLCFLYLNYLKYFRWQTIFTFIFICSSTATQNVALIHDHFIYFFFISHHLSLFFFYISIKF